MRERTAIPKKLNEDLGNSFVSLTKGFGQNRLKSILLLGTLRIVNPKSLAEA